MSDDQATDLTVGWGTTTLGQVTECILGGTPSTEVRQFWGGDVPWMASGDVHLRKITDVPGRITALGLRSSNATLTCPPAVAVGLAGQGKTRGTVALTLCTLSTNQSIALLKANGSELRTDYLFHNLDRRYEELRARSSGGGRGGLSKAILEAVPIELPPLLEQQKVAQILDTLDTAIHETEAIIAKLKAVKQGLLPDLLTRGIDAKGELRPTQAEAPHLYKQSPLGLIPKEWDLPVFGDTVDHIIDFRGRTPKKLGMDWGSGDILALSANNVQPGGIDVSREAYFGGERLYSKWMTSGDVRKGDVLLTMEAPLGNVAQIPDYARYILSQRVIALRFKSGMVLNDFAFWQMQSTEFQRAMVKRSTGSTATGIQRAELVKLHFKAPPVDEQSWIAQRLFSVEQKLTSELVALDKQKHEKSGLMDDLLTGRVRVTPLLEGVPP